MHDASLIDPPMSSSLTAGPQGERSPSRWAQRFFAWYCRRYLRKHLHAVRIRVAPMPQIPATTPVIAYLNHASWWDPLVAAVVARLLFPDRVHHAPIDVHGLRKYPFLSHLGFFALERASVRGAKTFLIRSLEVCSTPATALWLTPQGRFADPRERPTELAPGLGHLLGRLERAFVLPLALEYPFWEERTAEALLLSGEPLLVGPDQRATARQWSARLAKRLEAAQDELAVLSCARDSFSFQTIVQGRAGVGGVYDTWRATSALLRGKRFERAHGDKS